MFNLEEAIKEWKRSLRKNPGYEDGDIEELESHLIDRINHLMETGSDEEDAFLISKTEIGNPELLDSELRKNRSHKSLLQSLFSPLSSILFLTPNYIKVGFRSILRDKSNSFINIFGLSTALMCCIIIFMYVRQELTYDKFHENPEQIYRVTFQEINRPGARHFATSSPPMGPALVESFPEIEQFVRFRFVDSNILQFENNQFYEYDVAYADSALLTVFNFPLELGDPETALDELNSIILTHELAKKYFGEENPMGKSIVLDNITPLTVTGVFKPITEKTHFKFDCIISFHSFSPPPGYPVDMNSWGWVSFYTYLRLAEGTNPIELQSKFKGLLATNLGDEAAERVTLGLQSLDEIYLTPDLVNASADLLTANQGYITGMSVIAAFLLIIACLNFMNLNTAQSIRRGKEVGVRKTLGASKKGLVFQFLGESMLMAFLSVFIALILLAPFSNYISSFLALNLNITLADYKLIIPLFLSVGIFVGLLSGLYPAFVISAFLPSKVLKGIFDKPKSRFNIRSILVVTQFSIAILLITGSIIIRQQIQFIQEKDLGFNEEQVVVLHMDGRELTRRYTSIREQLLKNPSVVNAGMGGELFTGSIGSVPIFSNDIDDDNETGYPMNIHGVHFGYFETMGVQFSKGRGFDPSFSTDSANGIVINEKAAQILGWDDPIGKHIQVNDIKEGEIIGVVKDFNYTSLHNEIGPLVMYIPPTNMEDIFVRIKPGNIGEHIASLEKIWKEIVPDFPLDIQFLDENLNQLYQADQRFFRLVTAFTFLTILIACLGLYGLISYFIHQRTKEIGIRKVLGASLSQLTFLLSKKFLLLIGIANLVAWPVSWYLMKQWLNNFAYQSEISPLIYLLAGLIALCIASFTMGFKSFKAALIDPVHSLRNE